MEAWQPSNQATRCPGQRAMGSFRCASRWLLLVLQGMPGARILVEATWESMLRSSPTSSGTSPGSPMPATFGPLRRKGGKSALLSALPGSSRLRAGILCAPCHAGSRPNADLRWGQHEHEHERELELEETIWLPVKKSAWSSIRPANCSGSDSKQTWPEARSLDTSHFTFALLLRLSYPSFLPSPRLQGLFRPCE